MTITLPDVLFYLLAAMTGLSAIAVVVTQNIVRAATYLLFALAGTAGIFFLLGADFLGATQLLIYVGGTLVLVVFGVMLTAQGPFINMKIGAAEWAIGLGVGLLFYGVLAVVLSGVRAEVTAESIIADLKRGVGEDKILEKVSHVAYSIPLTKKQEEQLREARPEKQESIDEKKRDNFIEALKVKTSRSLAESKALGGVLLGDRRATPGMDMTGLPEGSNRNRHKIAYLLPFEIVSVHLLVVLIGAAYLARAKRRRGAVS